MARCRMPCRSAPIHAARGRVDIEKPVPAGLWANSLEAIPISAGVTSRCNLTVNPRLERTLFDTSPASCGEPSACWGFSCA